MIPIVCEVSEIRLILPESDANIYLTTIILFALCVVGNCQENDDVILPITRALSIKRRCFIVSVIRFCL